MADRNDLYGSGFQYPFRFSSATGGVERASAIESVRASLRRLFDTAPGEEFMMPEYGCAIKNLVFEQDTEVFRALCETVIREAVAQWEPRIAEIVDLQIARDDSGANPNLLTITVFFRLIESQTVDNFVYPFYTGA